LLQVLDVSAFGPLKADMRQEEMNIRSRHSAGRLDQGDALQASAESIRRVVVNSDWSSAFDRLGASPLDDVSLASAVLPYLEDVASVPALPSRAELAEIVGRSIDAPTVQSMHRLLIRQSLDLAARPAAACPKRGASVHLPASTSAQDHSSRRESLQASGRHDRICESFLDARRGSTRHLSAFCLSRQVVFTGGGSD